jgi:hypothetical protein
MATVGECGKPTANESEEGDDAVTAYLPEPTSPDGEPRAEKSSGCALVAAVLAGETERAELEAIDEGV